MVDGVPGALVSPDDRGLLYGDGLFETIAFHRRRSLLWPLHMERLRRGCDALGLPQPDEHRLAEECERLVGERARAVVRLALTRGVGGRAYFPPEQVRPTRILALRDFPDDLARRRGAGLTMQTSPVRLEPGPGGTLKHMNRLGQVLVANALTGSPVDEALVLDRHGRLVEALLGNLVVVRGDALIAPGPHPAAVAGVGLEWLRRRAGADLIERAMGVDELEESDGLWVINSVQGPCPVRCLDGRPRNIDGVVRKWQDAWRAEVEQ